MKDFSTGFLRVMAFELTPEVVFARLSPVHLARLWYLDIFYQGVANVRITGPRPNQPSTDRVLSFWVPEFCDFEAVDNSEWRGTLVSASGWDSTCDMLSNFGIFLCQSFLMIFNFLKIPHNRPPQVSSKISSPDCVTCSRAS